MTPDPKTLSDLEFPANLENLNKILEERPVLWVGAGASMAAGYPSTDQLKQAMVDAAERQNQEGISLTRPFFEIADHFVKHVGKGSLESLLQRELGTPRDPAPLHRAIARLAAAGTFSAIITTNYDNLLERVFDDARVRYQPQLLGSNDGGSVYGDLPLLKLHGSKEDWQRVVLSGDSYARFKERYPFLYHEMDLLLRRRSILFLGCSMKDPRILDWLKELTTEAAERLSRWRVLTTHSAWAEAIQYSSTYSKFGGLSRGNIRPLILVNHGQLEFLLAEAASLRAPKDRHEKLELTLEVQIDGAWSARMAGLEWSPSLEIIEGKEWQRLAFDLVNLQSFLSKNNLSSGESLADSLRARAISFGDKLTEDFLSPEAQSLISEAAYAVRGGVPLIFVVRVLPARRKRENETLADRVLALPWELLRIDGYFPVEEALLDLVRETLAESPRGHREETARSLSVVAIASVPGDRYEFNYEEEICQICRVLDECGRPQKFFESQIGTLQELMKCLEVNKPLCLHFSGYAGPGVLFFEDGSAAAKAIRAEHLAQQLRARQALPQLLFLSLVIPVVNADEAQKYRKAGEDLGEPSVADTVALLHRSGFSQVVAYFGAAGACDAARVAASFYSSLASTGSVTVAVRRTRQVLREVSGHTVCSADYDSLGWSRLVLYESRNRTSPVRPSVKKSTGHVQRHRSFQSLSHYGWVPRLQNGFVGRRRLLAEAIGRWTDGERFIVVVGLGGLGKTAFCTRLAPRLAEVLAPDAHVVALDCEYASKQIDPISSFINEIHAKGLARDSLGEAGMRKKRRRLPVEVLLGKIFKLAEDRQGLLVYLDGVEQFQTPAGAVNGEWCKPEIEHLWKGLVEMATPGSRIGLLASSRHFPAETPSRAHLLLSPMTRQEVSRFLDWWPAVQRISFLGDTKLVERLEGHPGTLEYFERELLEREQGFGHFEDRQTWNSDTLGAIFEAAQRKASSALDLETIWSMLDKDTQEHLGRCTVLRGAVSLGEVHALECVADSTTKLLRMGVLTPDAGGKSSHQWMIHGVAKRILEKLWQGDRKNAHRLVGKWLSASTEEPDEHA